MTGAAALARKKYNSSYHHVLALLAGFSKVMTKEFSDALMRCVGRRIGAKGHYTDTVINGWER
jgi:hypothetical protein